VSDPRFADVGAVEVRLTEELAEVIKTLQKAQRFGWDKTDPKYNMSNRDRTLAEMEDVRQRWNELSETLGWPRLRWSVKDEEPP
jgi:hypothetical protein